jgi:hypothetical protein
MPECRALSITIRERPRVARGSTTRPRTGAASSGAEITRAGGPFATKPSTTSWPNSRAACTLIGEAHARVGNERYAVANGSYGLTTLRERTFPALMRRARRRRAAGMRREDALAIALFERLAA